MFERLKRFARNFLIFVLGLAVAATAYLALERFSAGNRLADERLELVSSGLQRTPEQLIPPPTAAAIKNGQRLHEALGKLRKYLTDNRQVTQELRIMRPITPGVSSPAYSQPNPPFWIEDKKPNSKSWEQFEREIAGADDIISEIYAILEEPAVLPSDSLAPWVLSDISELNDLRRILTSLCILALRQDDIPSALTGMDTLRRAAAVAGQGRTLVSDVIEGGFWLNSLIPLSWEILQHPKRTEEDLSKLQELLRDCDPVPKFQRALEVELSLAPLFYEKAARSGALNVLANDGQPGSSALTGIRNRLWPHIWEKGDLALALGYWRRSIEASRQMRHKPNWAALASAMEQAQRNGSAYDRWRFPVSTVFEGTALSGARSAVAIDSRKHLAITATALERYRMRNERYPESLQILVTEFLPKVPTDWHAAGPLKYRRLPERGFLLYSCGENGTDDGGDATRRDGKAPANFAGRDLVWPRSGIAPSPAEP